MRLMVDAAPYSATGGTRYCEAISQVAYYPRRLPDSVMQKPIPATADAKYDCCCGSFPRAWVTPELPQPPHSPLWEGIPQGLAGAVESRIVSISVPVFWMPWLHQEGRNMCVPGPTAWVPPSNMTMPVPEITE